LAFQPLRIPHVNIASQLTVRQSPNLLIPRLRRLPRRAMDFRRPAPVATPRRLSIAHHARRPMRAERPGAAGALDAGAEAAQPTENTHTNPAGSEKRSPSSGPAMLSTWPPFSSRQCAQREPNLSRSRQNWLRIAFGALPNMPRRQTGQSMPRLQGLPAQPRALPAARQPRKHRQPHLPRSLLR
jgi:hypothetical protein